MTAPNELPAEQPPESEARLELPALPQPGLATSVAGLLALPGQWIGWLLYVVLLPFGFEGHWQAWPAMAIILGLVIRREYTLRKAMQRQPPLPAILARTGDGALHASVLVAIALDRAEVTLRARTVPLGSRRRLGRAVPDGSRTIGYLFHDFGRERFMPLIAQTDERTAAWADPARMPAIYFELLALCLREGASDGTTRAVSVPLQRVRSLLDGAYHLAQGEQHQEQPAPAVTSSEASLAHEALWCAGLPLRGEVTATAQDLESLAHCRRRALRRGFALLAATTVPLGALLLLVTVGFRALPEPVAITCMLLVLLSVVFYRLPYQIYEDLKLAFDARRAALHNRVLLFEGRLAWDDAYGRDADVAWLVQHDLLRPDDLSPQSLRVTPERGLVIQANGKNPSRPLLVYVTSLAEGDSMVVSLPTDVRARVTPGHVVRRRRLTAPERAELDRHVRRLRPVRFTTVLLPLAAVLSYAVAHEYAPWWIFLGYAFWVLVVIRNSYRRFRGQRRLEADLAAGWVLIVAPEGKHQAPNARIEFLGASGTLWAELATPAGWRRQKRL